MDEDDISGTTESSESLCVSLEEALLLLGIPNWEEYRSDG